MRLRPRAIADRSGPRRLPGAAGCSSRWTGLAAGHADEAVPLASGRVAVCGNAANAVAATLAARGSDVMLLAARAPGPADLVAVALERHAGHLPPRATVPLYVDAPEARLPAGAGVA